MPYLSKGGFCPALQKEAEEEMIFGSQLTPEQLIERRKGIGASDAAKIIQGGPAWAELWKDKTGREVPKRIMSEWDAALRHCTEGLQCDWYEHKTGERVGSRGTAQVWDEWPVMRCTLDGLTVSSSVVFEAKHVSQFTPDPINWAIEKYTPQVMHQMIVCKADKAVLSIVVGMAEPKWVTFTLDPFQVEAYLERCHEFWGYVERDEPPPGAEAMPLSVISYEEMKAVDLSGNNEFGAFADDWKNNKSAAKSFSDAEKALKGLVEPDVKLAFNDTIEIKRNKAGSLSIKERK